MRGLRERGVNALYEVGRLGRPSLGPDKEKAVRRLLSKGIGIVKTAKTVGVGVSAVQRIKAEMNDSGGLSGLSDHPCGNHGDCDELWNGR